MDWCSDVKFQPFVGERYFSEERRILIIGESHYGFGEGDSDATTITMRSWQNGDPKLRFLTILARILTGKAANELDRANSFEGVAWYNYLQAEIRKDAEGISTNFRKNIEGSRRAFVELLERLRPTHVLVNGRGRLWNILRDISPKNEELDPTEFAGLTLPLRRYRFDETDALAIPIHHTSRSSADQWHEPVKAFLAS